MVIRMKKIAIKLIKLYQFTPLHSHNNCRHIPTCSNYAIEAIDKYNFFKGLFLTTKRIIKCNPLGSFGYDPVPERKNK